MYRLGRRTNVVCAILMIPAIAPAAAFTTKLQGNTIRAWDRYIQQFDQVDPTSRPLLDAGELPVLTDLNPEGGGAREDVPNGYIHHWIGAMRLPGVSAAQVQAVIEDYDHWKDIYTPDVRLASATPVAIEGGHGYDLRLVTEQVDRLLHFAFDAHFHVRFRRVGDFELVDSRSYLIRESDSGHAPYTDLRPEGDDHGILWRLNTYWRLRQLGSVAYAECQVISLSRKPLFGTRDHVKARARESLEATLRHTRERTINAR
jgi:hypothetical protein